MDICDPCIGFCDEMEVLNLQDYIFSNDFTRNIDAMIYTCGYENCAPGHSYGPVMRNGYLIHYILSGCGIYKARGKIFHLKEGDAFLICPEELIYYEADRKQPWSYTWIGMQGIKVKGYLERTSLLKSLVFHYDQDDRMRLCHEKMFEADQIKNNKDLIMNSIMYEYLFLLARKFPGGLPEENKKKAGYVDEALKYIESAYCDPITVQDIADRLNINRSYLSRLFRTITGISIQDYLLDYRIRQACILLKNSDLSIRTIAHSVSYMDALYFSRLFHRKKGMTPSEYRKHIR
ncbi:MAG: AraC family transcriptional regulator [Lachnospiraceae bacterium]|jgi:AraC-like DNA-binding protein|nr:AraC family transcriptional regulator [Lachnospiraceae bacterium]